jgi:hypothetical protein
VIAGQKAMLEGVFPEPSKELYATPLPAGVVGDGHEEVVLESQFFDGVLSPTHATPVRTLRLGDLYCAQVPIPVPATNGPRFMFVPIFFRIENGRGCQFTLDPTEWNRLADTRHQEFLERNRNSSSPTPALVLTLR